MYNAREDLIRKIQDEERNISVSKQKLEKYNEQLKMIDNEKLNYIGKYVTYTESGVTHYTMLVKEHVYNNNSLLLKGFVLRSDIYRNNLLNSYNLTNNGTICIPINGRNEKELKVIDKEKFDMFYDMFIESMMFSKKCFEKIDN